MTALQTQALAMVDTLLLLTDAELPAYIERMRAVARAIRVEEGRSAPVSLDRSDASRFYGAPTVEPLLAVWRSLSARWLATSAERGPLDPETVRLCKAAGVADDAAWAEMERLAAAAWDSAHPAGRGACPLPGEGECCDGCAAAYGEAEPESDEGTV